MQRLGIRWAVLAFLFFAPAANASREPVQPAGSVSARAAALGGAGSALPGSADTFLINPASLSQVLTSEVAGGFGNHDLGDQREGYAAGAVPLYGRLVGGAGVLHQAFPKGPQTEVDWACLSLAFPLSRNGRLLTGLNAKYALRGEAFSPGGWNTGRGAGVDLGLLYDAYRGDDLRTFQFGVVVSDPQTVIKTEAREILLPVVFKLGAWSRLTPQWSLAAGFDRQSAQAPGYEQFQVLRLGGEWTQPWEPLDALCFRLGYLQRLDAAGVVTAGAGAELGDWRADYALQVPAGASGVHHQLSVSWGWRRKEKMAEKPAPEASEAESKRAKPTATPALPAEDRLFSALSVAAEAVDTQRKSVLAEATPTPTPAPKPQARLVSQTPAAEETQDSSYAYHLNVPQSPADEESSSLAPELEMPGTFSGYLSGLKSGSGDLKIVNQDLRLHVVVNPFSPNGDGKQDRTIFVGRLESEKLHVARWTLYVLRGERVYRTYKGGSRLPHNLEWDGTDEKGKMLPDGTYDVLLRVFDNTGLELCGATQPVVIRTRVEPIKLEAPENLVLTGNRQQDKSLEIHFPKLPRSSDWKVVLFGPAHRKIFSQGGDGEVPEKIAWPPRVSGRVAPSGAYRVLFTYRDEVGLKGSAETGFKISYADFSVACSAQPALFRPGTAAGEGVAFSPEITGELKIARWRLRIFEEKQEEPLRELEGDGPPPASIFWDGKDSRGQNVAGGKIFQAVFTALSALGTEENAEPPQLQSDLGAYTGKQALTINLVRVLFGRDATTLDEPGAKSLAEAAKVIQQYKTDFSIQVLGYCDAVESKTNGLELSRVRARTVMDFLIRDGKIAAEKIQAVGHGSEKSLAADDSDAEQSKNRRVEVVLFAK